MYAFYHVWLRGNTIIHPAPVGLSIEGCSELHVRAKHRVSVNDVPEFNYVILYVYWLRSNMLHVVYISTDNKCHPAAVCISQGDNIVVKHWVCHALAYDVDSVSIKWKRGNLSLV